MSVATKFYYFVFHTENPLITLINVSLHASTWDTPVDKVRLDCKDESDWKLFVRLPMNESIAGINMRNFAQMPEVKSFETKVRKPRSGTNRNACYAKDKALRAIWKILNIIIDKRVIPEEWCSLLGKLPGLPLHQIDSCEYYLYFLYLTR